LPGGASAVGAFGAEPGEGAVNGVHSSGGARAGSGED
jgi:hypothetical protein